MNERYAHMQQSISLSLSSYIITLWGGCPRKLLGIIGKTPSVFKSNCCDGHMLWSSGVFLHEFRVYSIDSSTPMDCFLELVKFNGGCFSNSTGSFVSNRLFTPWIMKSSQGLVKHVIGCWTRPKMTSVYTEGRNVRVTMEFEIPERHVLRPTLSTDMIQWILRWERQKRCLIKINK